MAFWSALAEDQGRPVRVRLTDGPAPVAVDAADLTDVLDVLVDNVFAHTPRTPPSTSRSAAPGGQVLMEVADDRSRDRSTAGAGEVRAGVDRPRPADRAAHGRRHRRHLDMPVRHRR